jgi:hypothetical protein
MNLPNWVRVEDGSPPERRYVLLRIEASHSTEPEHAGGYPVSVVIGYARVDSSNGRTWFVTPGVCLARPMQITHWADCIPDGWSVEGWAFAQGER